MPKEGANSIYYLSPAQVAPYLGVSQDTWARTVRENPAAHVPFPVINTGCRLKIPAKTFFEAVESWGIPLSEEHKTLKEEMGWNSE